MNLQELHGAAVSAWFGVLAAEAAIEMQARTPESRRIVAVMHGWIDLVAEGPLIAITVATGIPLLIRIWPAPTLVLVKAALGLAAVAANTVCIALVAARVREDDDTRRIKLTRRITLAGTAIPIGLVAWVIGYFYLPGH